MTEHVNTCFNQIWDQCITNHTHAQCTDVHVSSMDIHHSFLSFWWAPSSMLRQAFVFVMRQESKWCLPNNRIVFAMHFVFAMTVQIDIVNDITTSIITISTPVFHQKDMYKVICKISVTIERESETLTSRPNELRHRFRRERWMKRLFRFPSSVPLNECVERQPQRWLTLQKKKTKKKNNMSDHAFLVV